MAHSALYTGWVRHRRHRPTGNRFRYRLFMLYLDLAELPGLFDRFWLWSARRPALAWLRREDHHGSAAVPLHEAVRDLVAAHGYPRPRGPIRLLTHLRYFGYGFNPVSFYYCFDESGRRLQTIVAEVNNTPWGEQHCYVLPVPARAPSPSPSPSPSQAPPQPQAPHRFAFDKAFHVSPFMPMDMSYDWRFAEPGRHLFVHMANWREGQQVFDATLTLRRRPISSRSLAGALLAYPFITARVTLLIHWQALRLWLKRVPFHAHPSAPPADTPAKPHAGAHS